MSGERVLSALPEHPAPDQKGPHRLAIEGLVRQRLVLDAADLADITQTEISEDFVCEEGWRVPGQSWKGVAVHDLLDRSGVLEGGRWVEFAAGDFRFSARLEEAREAVVALALNGEPLNHAHGGPARLLLPGGACFTSIKWLDRIEVRRDEGPNQAASTARARLGGG